MILQDNIIDTIYDILVKEFGFKESFREESMDVPLTSSYFNLDGIQLYQLLMRIEEIYNVYIEPTDIEKSGLFTLTNVKRTIESKILKYEECNKK